jgi:hypothetical protein
MIVSVDTVLNEMAAQGMIPEMSGLSPLKAADLVHAEAQFLVMRAALRAITDGRNLLLDISRWPSCAGPVAGSTGRIWQGLAGPAGGQRHALGG